MLAGSRVIHDGAHDLHALARGRGLAQDHVGQVVLAQADVGAGVGGVNRVVGRSRQRGRAGHTLLVDTRLGVGRETHLPLGLGVADVGVAVGVAHGTAEVALARDVGAAVGGLLHAEALHVARAVILLAAVDGLAVRREARAHVHLGARQRQPRGGEDQGRCRCHGDDQLCDLPRLLSKHAASRPWGPFGTMLCWTPSRRASNCRHRSDGPSRSAAASACDGVQGIFSIALHGRSFLFPLCFLMATYSFLHKKRLRRFHMRTPAAQLGILGHFPLPSCARFRANLRKMAGKRATAKIHTTLPPAIFRGPAENHA